MIPLMFMVLPRAAIAFVHSFFKIIPSTTASDKLTTKPANSPPNTTRFQLIFPIAHPHCFESAFRGRDHASLDGRAAGNPDSPRTHT